MREGGEDKGSYGGEDATKDEAEALVSIVMRIVLWGGRMGVVGRVLGRLSGGRDE